MFEVAQEYKLIYFVYILFYSTQHGTIFANLNIELFPLFISYKLDNTNHHFTFILILNCISLFATEVYFRFCLRFCPSILCFFIESHLFKKKTALQQLLCFESFNFCRFVIHFKVYLDIDSGTIIVWLPLCFALIDFGSGRISLMILWLLGEFVTALFLQINFFTSYSFLFVSYIFDNFCVHYYFYSRLFACIIFIFYLIFQLQ